MRTEMKTYEAMCIFYSEESVFKSGVEEVRAGLEKLDAQIDSEKHFGLRDLAYPIKKQNKGNYYYYVVKMSTQNARKTQKTFRHQKELIRFLMIRKD